MRQFWAALLIGLAAVSCSDSDGLSTPAAPAATDSATSITAVTSPGPTKTQDEALMDAVSKWTPTVLASPPLSTMVEAAKAGDTRLVVGGAADFVFGARFVLSQGLEQEEMITVGEVSFERRGSFGVNILSLRTPLRFSHGVGESVSVSRSNADRPTPTPLVPRPIPPFDPEVFLEFQDGEVSDEFKAPIRQGLSVGRAYFQSTLGIATTGPITVTYSPVKGCGGPPPERRGAAGSAGPSSICYDPTAFITLGAALVKSGGHEHFHNLQAQIGCSPQNDISEKPDLWLTEGTAEYFGWQAAMAFGISPGNYQRFISSGKARQAEVELRAYEYYSPQLGAQYQLWVAAVGYLVEDISSPAAWVTYCRARGQRIEWRTAFQSAFGLTTDEFYDRFSEWARR